MINIKNFDSNLVKIDKKLYQNIDIYYIGYITIEHIGDYESIHSVNPLYIIFGEVDGYIEKKIDINTSFFLLQIKYMELWDGIKNLIEKTSDKPGKHGKDFMKIRFNSDDHLPLSKILKLYNLTIIVRSVFQDDNNYYPEILFR